MDIDTIINIVSCIASVVFGILSIIFGGISIKLKIENKKLLNANIEIKNKIEIVRNEINDINYTIENKVFGVNIEDISKSANQVHVEIHQINRYNLSPKEIPSEILNKDKEEDL